MHSEGASSFHPCWMIPAIDTVYHTIYVRKQSLLTVTFVSWLSHSQKCWLTLSDSIGSINTYSAALHC